MGFLNGLLQVCGFLLVVGGAVAGGWALVTTKTSESWKEVASAEKERNRQLQAKLDDLTAELSTVKQKLAKLEMLPDLSQLLSFMREANERDEKRYDALLGKVDERFENLQGKLDVHHDKQIELMEAICKRLEALA